MERNIVKLTVTVPGHDNNPSELGPGSHIFMLPSTLAVQCSAVKESFSKDLSLFKLLTLEALPHGILHGNEPQCINTFNSQYHWVHHHSVHGAYIIQLLTRLKATCPYFSSCQKLAIEKFISNQT